MVTTFLTNNMHNLNFSDIPGNTFIGTSSSPFDLTTGDYNTMFGHENLINLTTGGKNTVVGNNNCLNLTTGIYNTIMGMENPKSCVDARLLLCWDRL